MERWTGSIVIGCVNQPAIEQPARIMTKHNSMVVQCGEWGVREIPRKEHFRFTAEFGMTYLEFGIDGGKPGRLPRDRFE